MKENESIQSMIPRLQTLLNNLRSFRTVYCNDDVNDKILRTPKWRTQGSTLRAFKDLEKMFLEELVGILIIQYQILQCDKKKSKGINLAFKTKQKGKSSSSRVVEISEKDSDESNSEGDDELNFHTEIQKKLENVWLW